LKKHLLWLIPALILLCALVFVLLTALMNSAWCAGQCTGHDEYAVGRYGEDAVCECLDITVRVKLHTLETLPVMKRP